MTKKIDTRKFTEILKDRFQKEMPKVRKQIDVYETHLKEGKLNLNPKIAPRFNL